ncbi:MAG: PLDc N-terminal domain-containing protein [Acidimicrobiales bacterium]
MYQEHPLNVLAYDLVDVFWSMLWFSLFFMWIYFITVLLTDILRGQDLSGWGKALWMVVLIVLPVIGGLAYLIARGDGIARRQVDADRRKEAASRSYVKDVAVTSGHTPAVEVAKLAELHDRGLLSDEEYVRQRTRALGHLATRTRAHTAWTQP